MRSILLSSNTSFSFFYTTKWKLLYITIFFGIKTHRKFHYKKKNPFCFLFICDGVPAAMVFCVVEKAKATATFGMPVSTSQYSQYLQIVLISIRQKKRSDSTSTQRGKVGCATISHFDSPWKSVKRSKEFLKLAYLDFYWRSKKRTAGNHEKGKSWKLRNLEYNCALKHKVSILAFLISYLFSFYSSSLLLELYP